jgi:hypothetical protein
MVTGGAFMVKRGRFRDTGGSRKAGHRVSIHGHRGCIHGHRGSIPGHKRVEEGGIQGVDSGTWRVDIHTYISLRVMIPII